MSTIFSNNNFILPNNFIPLTIDPLTQIQNPIYEIETEISIDEYSGYEINPNKLQSYVCENQLFNYDEFLQQAVQVIKVEEQQQQKENEENVYPDFIYSPILGQYEEDNFEAEVLEQQSNLQQSNVTNMTNTNESVVNESVVHPNIVHPNPTVYENNNNVTLIFGTIEEKEFFRLCEQANNISTEFNKETINNYNIEQDQRYYNSLEQQNLQNQPYYQEEKSNQFMNQLNQEFIETQLVNLNNHFTEQGNSQATLPLFSQQELYELFFAQQQQLENNEMND